MAVLGWMAVQDGGYEIRTWAPAGAIVLALVVLAVATVSNPWPAVPRSTRAAGCLLAGYCAWSYASVAWAADPGAAWQGANRTVVYLAAFVLFAAWRQRAATAAALLASWTGVVVVLALVVAVRLSSTDDPRTLLPRGRLLDPTGYANATATLFMMAFFGLVACLAARSAPWWLRGLAAGGAVVLADVGLLAVSRGSLLATPICLIGLLLVLPDRLRRLVSLLPIGAAVAVAAPRIIHLTDVVGAYKPPPGLQEARSVTIAIWVGAAVAASVIAAIARLEERRPASRRTARRAHRIGSILVGGLTAVCCVGALAVVGNPVTRLDAAWSSFKGGYAEYSGTRLGSGLGSNRYDFYRVAVRSFRDHPVAGVGADNFSQAYLREGHSNETPRYPHSLELRTLSETGVVGALLLFGAFVAALPAALRAARSRDAEPGGRVVATGGLMAFAYWVVHGSADWFFEYAGLGAAAFALLGLACSLDPARSRNGPGGAEIGGPRAVPTRLPRLAVVGLVAIACGLPALALLGEWAADGEVRRAGRVFGTRSGEAYARLDRARALDPFTAVPDSVAGSIAVRLGDPTRALARFQAALSRSPDDPYAQLQVGAAQSALGQAALARRSLQRATALAPRDAVAREALAVVRSGGTVDAAVLSARLGARGKVAN